MFYTALSEPHCMCFLPEELYEKSVNQDSERRTVVRRISYSRILMKRQVDPGQRTIGDLVLAASLLPAPRGGPECRRSTATHRSDPVVFFWLPGGRTRHLWRARLET